RVALCGCACHRGAETEGRAPASLGAATHRKHVGRARARVPHASATHFLSVDCVVAEGLAICAPAELLHILDMAAGRYYADFAFRRGACARCTCPTSAFRRREPAAPFERPSSIPQCLAACVSWHSRRRFLSSFSSRLSSAMRSAT